MIFIKLYLTFLKIGTFAFGGGYATISLIKKFVVEDNNWISMTEFMDIMSISQMTPGPIAVNCATFVGQKIAGIPGGIIATAGVITTQSILMLILGYFLFKKQKTFKFINYMIIGIKACVVSLILITAISLIQTTIFTENINIASLTTFILGVILYIKKFSIYKILVSGALLGFLINIIIAIL